MIELQAKKKTNYRKPDIQLGQWIVIAHVCHWRWRKYTNRSSDLSAIEILPSLLVQLKVTVEYKKDNGRMIPLRVHTIVISIQHSPAVSTEQMEADLNTKVIQVRVLILSPPIH